MCVSVWNMNEWLDSFFLYLKQELFETPSVRLRTDVAFSFWNGAFCSWCLCFDMQFWKQGNNSRSNFFCSARIHGKKNGSFGGFFVISFSTRNRWINLRLCSSRLVLVSHRPEQFPFEGVFPFPNVDKQARILFWFVWDELLALPCREVWTDASQTFRQHVNCLLPERMELLLCRSCTCSTCLHISEREIKILISSDQIAEIIIGLTKSRSWFYSPTMLMMPNMSPGSDTIVR